MTSSYSQIIKLIKSKRDISKIPGKVIGAELHLQVKKKLLIKIP